VTSPSTTWLIAIPSFLYFLFCLVALLYVMSKRSDNSSAKTFAIAGIGILFFLQIFGFISSLLIGRYLGTGDYVFYHGLLSLVKNGMQVLAMSLLIAAVFIGRSSELEPASPDKLVPGPSDNPYSSPVS
jgi:hypothetical protein